jgi:tetratricopeptide (TPR) repeat protein
MGLPYFILGLYSKKEKKVKDAMENFVLAYKTGYLPLECCIQIIDTEMVGENWKRTLARARQMAGVVGRQAEFYFLRGYSNYKSGKMKDAVTSFKRALQQKPYFVEGIKNLALLYYLQENYEEAVPLLRKALKIRPSDSEADFYLKKCLAKEGIQENDKKPVLTKNFVDKVKVKYKYSIKGEIDLVSEIINKQVMASLREGNIEDAKNILLRFLEINDAPLLLYYNLSQIHNTLKEYEQALKITDEIIKFTKDFKEAHDLLGELYFSIEEYDQSLEAFKKVVKIDKKDSMGYYNLGCAHNALEEFTDAEKNWRKAIALDRSTNKSEESETKSDNGLAYSLVVLKTPVSLKAHMSLGLLYIRQNKHEQAIEEFSEVVKVDAEYPESYLQLGKIFQKKGDVKNAVKHYEKYLYLGGEDSKVKEYLDSKKEKS